MPERRIVRSQRRVSVGRLPLTVIIALAVSLLVRSVDAQPALQLLHRYADAAGSPTPVMPTADGTVFDPSSNDGPASAIRRRSSCGSREPDSLMSSTREKTDAHLRL